MVIFHSFICVPNFAAKSENQNLILIFAQICWRKKRNEYYQYNAFTTYCDFAQIIVNELIARKWIKVENEKLVPIRTELMTIVMRDVQEAPERATGKNNDYVPFP